MDLRLDDDDDYLGMRNRSKPGWWGEFWGTCWRLVVLVALIALLVVLVLQCRSMLRPFAGLSTIAAPEATAGTTVLLPADTTLKSVGYAHGFYCFTVERRAATGPEWEVYLLDGRGRFSPKLLVHRTPSGETR